MKAPRSASPLIHIDDIRVAEDDFTGGAEFLDGSSHRLTLLEADQRTHRHLRVGELPTVLLRAWPEGRPEQPKLIRVERTRGGWRYFTASLRHLPGHLSHEKVKFRSAWDGVRARMAELRESASALNRTECAATLR